MSPLRSHCTNSRQICPLNRSEEEEQWLRCEWSSELPSTRGGGGGGLLHQFQSSLARGASSISCCRWEAAWSSFDSSRRREEIWTRRKDDKG